MKDLILLFVDGTSGRYSVPDRFGYEDVRSLIFDHADTIDEFSAGDGIQIVLAIRGDQIRTAVLTSGGQVLEEPPDEWGGYVLTPDVEVVTDPVTGASMLCPVEAPTGDVIDEPPPHTPLEMTDDAL